MGVPIVQPRSNIPLVQTSNGEVLPASPFSRVVLSSVFTNWSNIVVEEHHFPSRELESGDLMHTQDVIAVNVGRSVTCEFSEDGRFQRVSNHQGGICLFPSHRPFSWRTIKDRDGVIDVLYLALDPVFVSQTAEALEVYPDHVELVKQRRDSDPALWYIANALRAGIQAEGGGDRMYGEALSTALAVHLVREYSGRPPALLRAHGGLPRDKLIRAIEYIKDQLHTDLTVAEIAGAVNMSPHHFTLLFKQSTGRSPYRYVLEARTNRARELLASGRFSISDIAYRVGFADQSHLTRQVKQLFGTTPKMLQERRHPEPNSSKDSEEYPIEQPL